PDFNTTTANESLARISSALPADVTLPELTKAKETIEALKADIAKHDPKNVKERLSLRKRFTILKKSMEALLNVPYVISNEADRKIIKDELKGIGDYTSYVPTWCILVISVSLGLGTMIGWKRIVVTIGEKIGKRHMTFAEGATAELIAASTIGLASQFGLPVSTTHVLSSGVAGAMVASKGVKNLQGGTIKSIAIAWLLTLPVTVVLSGLLYFILRKII
ncbi:MAG: inorganic phosphate transporter, partial [Saprospiraceae bacterium]|nr:inorganic phosphate transporter [Saprospiraceae bacterium]